MIGIASQKALGESAPVEDPRTISDHSFIYDISVRNNSTKPVDIRLGLSRENTEQPKFSQRFKLGRPGSGSEVTRQKFTLSGGAYTVRVVTGEGQPVSTTWGIPPGGIPDWMALSIHIKPNSNIRFYKKEI